MYLYIAVCRHAYSARDTYNVYLHPYGLMGISYWCSQEIQVFFSDSGVVSQLCCEHLI